MKYTRLNIVEPTSDLLNKEMIIFTKDGQKIQMRIYKVEKGKLFGIDKKDNKHEILISEIQQATLLTKHDAIETCLLLGVITSAILFIVYYLSFKIILASTTCTPFPSS